MSMYLLFIKRWRMGSTLYGMDHKFLEIIFHASGLQKELWHLAFLDIRAEVCTHVVPYQQSTFMKMTRV